MLLIDHIKQFDEDAWNGWKEILDTNSQRFWNDVKNKFLSTEFQSSVRIIENIMGTAAFPFIYIISNQEKIAY